MPEYQDHEFYDVCKSAEELIDQGMDVYQKFTCAGCGQRLTMDVPNVFYLEGSCDKCPAVTDIEKQGCNYLVHARIMEN